MYRSLLTTLCMTVAATSLSGCGKRMLSAPDQSRAVAQACSEKTPGPGTCGIPSSTSSSDQLSCISDANCTAGVNGRCMGTVHPGCYCQYDTCESDASCGSNQVCICRDTPEWGGANTCITGNCRINADCPSGYCSLDESYGTGGYFCHTDRDTCHNDSDCSSVQDCFGDKRCRYSSEVGYWQCLCVPVPV